MPWNKVNIHFNIDNRFLKLKIKIKVEGNDRHKTKHIFTQQIFLHFNNRNNTA